MIKGKECNLWYDLKCRYDYGCEVSCLSFEWTGADAIKKFTPSLGIPYLEVLDS